jgi:nucleoid-associated protein YgaU
MATLTILPRVQTIGRATPTMRVIRTADDVRERSRAVPRAVRCDHSFAPDLRGSRLTARGRAVVALVWLALAVVAAVPITQLDSASSNRPTATTTVVVAPGTTLWGLARSIDATADPRVLVDAMVDLNGLGSAADIHPGDVLVVPRR